jgi:hypothetical protein
MNPAVVFATHAVAGDVLSRESLRQCAIYVCHTGSHTTALAW